MSDKYDDAAEWAEHDMKLPKNSPSALRGEAAAALGRSLLEAARPPGRPSIDPDKAPGEPTKVRQVRLSAGMDEDLIAYAAQHKTTPSAVLRAAAAEFLENHRIAG